MSTSNAESSKTLAAVGALLMFLSFVPVLGIIGIILLFLGLKGLSEYYRDETIISDALKGLVFGIIGIIGASAFILLLGFTGAIFFGAAAAIGVIAGIIGALAIAFVFYLLMAMNFKRAFDTLAQKTGEHGFQTAGSLLWWGAILTIIIVGFVLVWIAFLILAIAFFSLRIAPAQPYSQQQYGYAPPPSTAPPTQGTRYCPNCGAPVAANATYCPNCGKQLPLP